MLPKVAEAYLKPPTGFMCLSFLFFAPGKEKTETTRVEWKVIMFSEVAPDSQVVPVSHFLSTSFEL